jgi:hypothetical protein
MQRFIESESRAQATLLPERLDDWIAEDNPVRAVDAFVDELDVAKLGFEGAEPAATRRPAYHPGARLRLIVGSRHKPVGPAFSHGPDPLQPVQHRGSGPAPVSGARDSASLERAELADGQDQPDDQQHEDDEAPEHEIDSHHCFLAIRAASLK